MQPNDVITANVTWDKAKSIHKCWLNIPDSSAPGGRKDVAILELHGLPPMTYAVAAIEGYLLKNGDATNHVSKKGLPSPVIFENIAIQYDDPNVDPVWRLESGRQPAHPQVHYGRNRLRSYSVTQPTSDSLLFLYKPVGTD